MSVAYCSKSAPSLPLILPDIRLLIEFQLKHKSQRYTDISLPYHPYQFYRPRRRFFVIHLIVGLTAGLLADQLQGPDVYHQPSYAIGSGLMPREQAVCYASSRAQLST